MYESHWIDLISRWSEAPQSCRERVLDEVLFGKGVPPRVRASLWLVASGAARKAEIFPQAYGDYLAEARQRLFDQEKEFQQVELQVRKDIKRTFPLFAAGVPGFSVSRSAEENGNAGATIGQENGQSKLPYDVDASWRRHEQSLYHVLLALGTCFRRTSYHQGLNYVAAFLLLMKESELNDEEKGRNEIVQPDWTARERRTFWLIHCVLEDYHMAGIYEHQSSFMQQYLDQFDLLVRRFLPRLHRHLDIGIKEGYPVVLFGMEWFTTIFSYSLRLDAVYLIWDLFLVARLDEALFVAGLAILDVLKESLMQINSFEGIADSFKTLVKGITARELQESIAMVVQRIVPSTLIPPGRSTLASIERAMQDADNELTTADFDATRFVDAVQLGDDKTVQTEMKKYNFPATFIEEGLYRAVFLGHAAVAKVLLQQCDASCRSLLASLDGISPLHICALTGHPATTTTLLNAGADRNLRSFAKPFRSLFPDHIDRDKGFTPFELAKAVARISKRVAQHEAEVTGRRRQPMEDEFAVLVILEGNSCLSCGRVLQRRSYAEAQQGKEEKMASNMQDDASGISSGSMGSTSSSSRGFTFRGFLYDRIIPDWSEAVARGHSAAFGSWNGDFCVDCTKDAHSGLIETCFNQADMEFVWNCTHCRKVILGAEKRKCCRCHLTFCETCCFTRRRLLPKCPDPVPVCSNCHHVLRSCPCQAQSNETYAVFCDHSPVDYCLPQKVFCSCLQCVHRRFVLKAPIQKARPFRYDTRQPLFSTHEAVARGFWGHNRQSRLTATEEMGPNESLALLLAVVNNVEEFVMHRIRKMRLAGSSPRNAHANHQQNASAAPLRTMLRDYRTELIEFYTTWNPSQVGRVDTLLQKYRGKEEKLLRDLHSMYARS